MSTITAASRTPYVHWLTESRPPSLTWARPSPPESNQPVLDLIDHEQDAAEIAESQHRGVRLSTVRRAGRRSLGQGCRILSSGVRGWRWPLSRRCWASVRLLSSTDGWSRRSWRRSACPSDAI